MKNGLFCGAAVAALAWCAPVIAQDNGDAEETSEEADLRIITMWHPVSPDRILVTGGRGGIGTRDDNYNGSATIITREQIVTRQVRDVADALRDVPGVAVSGVAGQTQVRLRGSEANHVLVLVDGIEVSDPFGGEFDMGTLQAEVGSSLEVLRGPQSALYGSDAIGGVIAYRSGEFDGFGGFAEAGSFGTFNSAVRLGKAGEGWEGSLSAAALTTDGQPNARGGERPVGRDSYTLSGRGSVELGEQISLRAATRYISTSGDFNDQDFDTTSPTFGFVIDSPETRFENQALYALVGALVETMDGSWVHNVSVQLADIKRDTFGPFGRTFGSEGERLKGSYVSSIIPADGHYVTLAADWERERFRNTDPFDFAFTETREIENVGLVGEYRYDGDKFDISAAIRHDFNDRFADATTFKIGAGYNVFEDTRIRANAGTGIKNPGFYELFGFIDGRFIGNDSLTPEKSTSWEVGVDQYLFDRDVTLSLTYFDAELEDEIFTSFPAPDFIATPSNRETVSKQRGVELAADIALGSGFSADAAYTWLDAEENGIDEVRRPEHVASAAINWTAPDDKMSATLVIRHNGEAFDDAFTDPSFVPVRVTLNDYTLVNLNARLNVTDDIEVFARVENLLDQTYEQVFSFVSQGRSATLGIRASF